MKFILILACLMIGLRGVTGAGVALETEFRVVRDAAAEGFAKLFIKTPTGFCVPINAREDDPNFEDLLKIRAFVHGTIVLSVAEADFAPYWLEHARQVDNLRKEFGRTLSVKTPFWIPRKGMGLMCVVVSEIKLDTRTFKLRGALEEWAKVTYL